MGVGVRWLVGSARREVKSFVLLSPARLADAKHGQCFLSEDARDPGLFGI